MPSPNLLNLSEIFGKSTGSNVTTVLSTVLSNQALSSNLFRINSIVVSNINGVSSADISTSIQKGGVDYFLGSTVLVPADTTLVLATKDMNLYLEETDAIRAAASANNFLQMFISYEVIR